ncbi:chromatin assembly factor 1 subunit fas1 [Phtheirospermum japonicum]|uniref:Chromatin assembly factor 1 subunit fas1 n=1 Tax=Phtheirospermum japonicum TaxID=374723 RepID=A0A830BRC9_9LAMI|nr:chromatin assembly factor 1 subunit fas1 [Phtheirospermum japonicum]
MAEAEPMKIDGADERKTIIDEVGQKKKQLKRKRLEPCLFSPSPEEKHAKIVTFRNEIGSLVKFCKGLGLESRGALLENVEKVGNSLNAVIACLMEESDLSLSKLVDEIFEKVKGRNGISESVSKASVKSTVLIIGQRLCYGVISPDADVLEDEDECALWCWETRDLKLLPKLMRASLKVRRTCRKKIQERITAVMAMINALEKSEDRPSCPQELMKASEKLSKVLSEADIRLLIKNMSQKSGAEMAEKDAKREEKLLIKQMEKNKREMEKERKKMDRELQKEKLQSEKELKRLHDEAEKEERRREKEENEMQKQLKKQQEEAEKEQKRKEKEEAESRKRLALQKQASLMERFLKRSQTNSPSQNDSPMNKATTSGPSANVPEKMPESVSLAMDSVLAQNGGVEAQDLWSSHLNAWRCIGRSMHSNRKMHWGIRQKPKIELVKELKLSANKDDDMNAEKLAVGWVDSNADRTLSHMDMDSSSLPGDRKRIRVKKLLQFDKSNRPAFYGVYPKESQVVGGRHPYVKDPDIEYEIDSDEEWEEEEPGESLSDCEKDEEEESTEGRVKDDDDDEDESEDGFFVPDGYLSENEGANSGEMESDDLVEVRNPPNSVQQVQSEEFCTLLWQQKHLNNFTEHALKKNQPLIILNLMHEKTILLSAEELTGTEKIERMCLQALSIRPLPGFPDIGISIRSDVIDEDNEVPSDKASTTRPATGASILDSDLPQIISVIQSCPINIGKIGKLLHDKFPAVPKSHLKNKVREISEFYDNRWQVKKEILSKYGLSVSPERTRGKTKSIASFLKRCMPPSGKNADLTETSPQSSKKTVVEPHQDYSCENR